MSNTLNDIHLNHQMIISLYGRSIVRVNEVGLNSVSNRENIEYLGNNAQNVTTLVSSSLYRYVSDEELVFLNKMFSACKLNLGDVAIVNIASVKNFDNVILQLSPSRIINFCEKVSLSKLNHIPIIHAPSLSDLMKETSEARHLKTKLWASLKNMFSM